MGFPPGPRLYTGGQTKELAAGVERALAALPPKEAQIIRLRFGVSVETPQTLNEIGAVGSQIQGTESSTPYKRGGAEEGRSP
jgi:hypothetical protein